MGPQSLVLWKSTRRKLAIRVYCITVYSSMEKRHGVTLLQHLQHNELVSSKACGVDLVEVNARCTTMFNEIPSV